MNEKHFLKFEESKTFPGTYNVLSSEGKMIGEIIYYQKWSTYVFEPYKGTVWSVECLNDIIEFIKKTKKRGKDDGSG